MKSNNLRNFYISQLNSNLQLKIRDELTDFFSEELELNQEDLDKKLGLAMNSRVSNLEETIDTKKY